MARMEWFKFWYEDKRGMISLMYKNMAADLDAGYDPIGKSIQLQKQRIDDYERDFQATLMSFADMDDAKRDRWCYYDMLRRGVISV